MSSEPPIYLDHAATAPVLAAAREAVIEGLARWANPSSPHAAGRAARAALEDARSRIAQALGWRHELILTSGATEALTIALSRALRHGRAIGAGEHDAVMRAAPDAQILSLDDGAQVCLDELAPGALVAIQQVNNETGVLQDLDCLIPQVREVGGLFLADCAQSAGKLVLPQADFIAISAHKFGGPSGVGALLVRDLATLAPSGGQEKGYRGGTENLPGALGMAAALEAGTGWLGEAARLRDWLDGEVETAGGVVIARDAPRLPTVAAYRMPGVSSAVQLIRFDTAGIAVSAGSACSSGSMKASRVLAAMGLDPQTAGEVIRVSIGRETTRAQLSRFLSVWRDIAGRASA